MSFILGGGLQDKYNWVDVCPIAEALFNDHSFELHWAEDAWNLLMFNVPVKEKNIVPRYLDNNQKGDVIIWLLTLYQFYFDFKCIIEIDTPYFDHDVGVSGLGTYRSIDLIEKIYEIENGVDCLTRYLWNDVFIKLNELAEEGKVPKQTFYDTENKCFSFSGQQYENIYHTEREPEDDSVAKLVLLQEIELRREYFRAVIFKAFDSDETKMIDFLTGYHWVREYSDYNKRKGEIERAFAFKKKVFEKEGNAGFKNYTNYENDEYESADEINEEMEFELRLLNGEYVDVAVDSADEYLVQKISAWINDGMHVI